MSLPLRFSPTALYQLRELEKDAQNEILTSLRELRDQQFTHPDVKMIRSNDFGEIWRLKVKKDHTDHRIFFDITENPVGIHILTVKHRDDAYT